jgi:myosin-6
VITFHSIVLSFPFQMCELAVHETGLTRKRGAEILDYEFEREWQKNGGKPYIKAATAFNGRAKR